MKGKLLGIGFSVLLIGLALPAFIMVLTRGTSAEGPAVDVTEFKGISLYPQARQVYSSTDDRALPVDHRFARPGGGAHLSRTSDRIEQVESFYTRNLTEQGWLLLKAEDQGWRLRNVVNPNAKDSDGRRLAFILNASETNSYRTYLVVALLAFPEGETEIELEFWRWPDPERVPIYPGAEDLQITEAKVPDLPPDSDLIERSIVYYCDGTPATVETYYKEQLAEHGWWLDDVHFRPGLPFNYGHPGTTASSVWVNVKGAGEGRTRVEL